MKARTDTMRLYRFERLYLTKQGARGAKDTPIEKLRHLAITVWINEGRSLEDCPSIVAGAGEFYGGGYVSAYYTRPWHKIVMSRTQRNAVVLLHEMAHALGAHYHNERFSSLYFKLLERYLGYDIQELVMQAAWLKIKVKVE